MSCRTLVAVSALAIASLTGCATVPAPSDLRVSGVYYKSRSSVSQTFADVVQDHLKIGPGKGGSAGSPADMALRYFMIEIESGVDIYDLIEVSDGPAQVHTGICSRYEKGPIGYPILFDGRSGMETWKHMRPSQSRGGKAPFHYYFFISASRSLSERHDLSEAPFDLMKAPTDVCFFIRSNAYTISKGFVTETMKIPSGMFINPKT